MLDDNRRLSEREKKAQRMHTRALRTISGQFITHIKYVTTWSLTEYKIECFKYTQPWIPLATTFLSRRLRTITVPRILFLKAARCYAFSLVFFPPACFAFNSLCRQRLTAWLTLLPHLFLELWTISYVLLSLLMRHARREATVRESKAANEKPAGRARWRASFRRPLRRAPFESAVISFVRQSTSRYFRLYGQRLPLGVGAAYENMCASSKGSARCLDLK